MPQIDHGRPFDWSRVSEDYAACRDIYPPAFYQALLSRNLCTAGQRVLDLGTGTGVLPRALYGHGARFTGLDSAPGQIAQARRLADKAGMEIEFVCAKAEQAGFPDASFDIITACQCFFYFDHTALAPVLHRLLQPSGRLAVLYMGWLPNEDPVAAATEQLILRHNPQWTGGNGQREAIDPPAAYARGFSLTEQAVFDLDVPFTRASWQGRIRACRGVGASLEGEALNRFEREHASLLARIAPPSFTVRHYAALTVLTARPDSPS